jgi:nitrite reductase/ring-hydroxylating ferredoxin subunit
MSAPRRPLADGLIDGEVVMCPMHNHQFSLSDGTCASGTERVAAYTSADEDGELVVCLSPTRWLKA